jgi:hypothetical protein
MTSAPRWIPDQVRDDERLESTDCGRPDFSLTIDAIQWGQLRDDRHLQQHVAVSNVVLHVPMHQIQMGISCSADNFLSVDGASDPRFGRAVSD